MSLILIPQAHNNRSALIRDGMIGSRRPENAPAFFPASICGRYMPSTSRRTGPRWRIRLHVMKQPSCNDLFRHDSGHVGQAEIAPAITICQTLVIESEQVKYGRVEIVDVHAVFDGVVADVVGGAVNESRFHSAAGHPDRIAVGVVVAPVAAFADRGAPEFARPDDQR